jgi:FKBP-type peptidyl-prolyl cis-trans isomerase FkpA
MNKLFLLAPAAMVLFSSCKENTDFEGFTRAENGLHYKFYNQNENGVKAKEGDMLNIRWIFALQKNDSVIFDSKNASQDGSGFAEIRVAKPTFKGSFEDALMMMSKGDSASFIVRADSFFIKTNRMNELPKWVNSGDYLKASFKIRDIRGSKEVEEEQKKQMEKQEAMIKEFQAKEQPSLDKYLADNNVKAKPTASGLYYIETKKGSGGNPKSSDLVKVHYTGKLLDGTKFDSSVDRGEPAEFPLDRVIPGWTEGLQLMKKGGKAMLIIPSSLGYGPNGSGAIPPYSPLVFEVELIDFKEAPAQQGPPPQPH